VPRPSSWTKTPVDKRATINKLVARYVCIDTHTHTHTHTHTYIDIDIDIDRYNVIGGKRAAPVLVDQNACGQEGGSGVGQ